MTLTFQGNDVAIVGRRVHGQAVLVFLDRHGRAIEAAGSAIAWHFQLRGRPMPDLRRAVARAPLIERTYSPAAMLAAAAVADGAAEPRPSPSLHRGFLFAHHAHKKEDD